ncbi:unnamed protein product [Parnassius mnemosyne]|uniref:PiggyBac transposable element-derived protein domain-containing protein n=1 Tax=Parnassius mnemosyne TaxID=213953 RepID=A0AAV1M341_9NEOP
MADSKTFYTYNIEPYVGTNEGPYNLSNSASDVVKRLVTPIRGSHRNIVMDSWYTSLPLSQDLLHEYGLTSLGTIRKNKPQIPAIFSATQRREEKSSLFGFQNDCTLVSYVPRKNKVVLLVTTMHHDASIDQNSGEKNLPEIIADYNRYKCGVDVVDELCGTYSVSRITKRWPLVIFFGFKNIAGINAYVIAKQNKENLGQTCDDRRNCLKQLALALSKPLVKERQLITNLPKEIKKYIELVVGIEEPVSEAAQMAPSTSSSSRCSVCTWKKDRKTKTSCKFCFVKICKEHTIPICDNCYQERK